MRSLLFAALLFSSSAFAGFIPATDVFGNPESGDELILITDITSIANGTGDGQFATLLSFGGFNSSDRAFGISLWNSTTQTLGASLAIFDNTDISNPIAFSNVIFDSIASTLTVGANTVAIPVGFDIGFYFVSDGATTYSMTAANTGSNAGDHFGFYNQSTTSFFDLRIYASDADSGNNLDFAWIGIADARATRAAIPEPSIIGLFALSLMALGFRRAKS